MFSIAETTWPTSTPSSAIWDGAEQNWLLAKHQRWTSLMLLRFNGNKIPAARLVLQQINGLSFGIIVLHKVIAVVYFTLSDSAFFLQISGWLYRFVSRGHNAKMLENFQQTVWW